MGPKTDGVYLIPIIAAECKACFSPGVSLIPYGMPKAGYDLDVINTFVIPLFMIDPKKIDLPNTFENTNIMQGEIGYNKKNKASVIVFSEWVDKYEINLDSELLLQMDIEGFECDIFINEDIEFFSIFKVMILEFQDLAFLSYDEPFSIMNNFMNRILKEFGIVHIHPNNTLPILEHEVNIFSNMLEITLINWSNVFHRRSNTWQLNGSPPRRNLDFKCFKDKEELYLPIIHT